MKFFWILELGVWSFCPPLFAQTPNPSEAPSTPREFYNAGTQQLRQGNLREAEALLESALSSQQERFVPPALYNLGHVRFDQGADELKKSPAAGPTLSRGHTDEKHAADILGMIDDALGGNDV